MKKNPFRPMGLLCLFLLLSFSLHSQFFTEKIGGTPTQFKITSKDKDVLNDTHQLIIRRAQKRTSHDGAFVPDFGFAYAYESYHLEFMTNSLAKFTNIKGKKGDFYQLKFYNDQEELIFSRLLSKSNIRRYESEESLYQYIYSINLKEVPMIILDQTSRIDFIEVIRRRL